MKSILIAALLLFFVPSSAHIRLPAGFACNDIEGLTNNGQTFNKNGYMFLMWNYGKTNDNALKAVKADHPTLKFSKTKDGLWWGTGRDDNEYRYIVIVPRYNIELMVYSTKKGRTFSNYSSWLLQEVRNALGRGEQPDFVTANGENCYPG